MAVKHQKTKTFPYSKDAFFAVLSDARFYKTLEAKLLEEAKTANGIEFRFYTKTSYQKYGRNFTVTVAGASDANSKITVSTQSRKVTVLWDPLWEKEVNRIFSVIETFIELKNE